MSTDVKYQPLQPQDLKEKQNRQSPPNYSVKIYGVANSKDFNPDDIFLVDSLSYEPPVRQESKDVKVQEPAENKQKTVLINFSKPLTQENRAYPFDPKKLYIARISSFAAGAELAIKQAAKAAEAKAKAKAEVAAPEEKALTSSRLEAINTLLKTEIKRINVIDEPDFGKALFKFEKDLEEKSGVKKKHLALAEAMYVWQEVPPPIRETRYQQQIANSKQTFTIIQRETPISAPLTENQKTELFKIRNEAEHPEWFKKLPPFARTYLLTIVPETREGHWAKCQKAIPATLRGIPGQANATKHELVIVNNPTVNENILFKDISETDILLHTSAVRQSTPTSYDMPDTNRQESASENLAQMLNEQLGVSVDGGVVDEKNNARQRMADYWYIEPIELENLKLACPVLLGGLLTNAKQSNFGNWLFEFFKYDKTSNERLTAEKHEAMAQYRSARPSAMYEFYDLNVAVNDKRSRNLRPDENFVQKARELRKKINDRDIASVDGHMSAVKIKQRKKLDKLKNAIEELERLQEDPTEVTGRNRAMHIAALYDLTTRLMGGVSTGNCKSAKDRKGVEFMYADAMEIYYQLYNRFPSYLEDGNTSKEVLAKRRQQFTDIFCNLYASGHQLLAAHDNSPGAAGIKDEGILDEDIKKQLGDTYEFSKISGDFNKPGTSYQKYKNEIWSLGLGLLLLVSTKLVVLIFAFSHMALLALPILLMGLPIIKLIKDRYGLKMAAFPIFLTLAAMAAVIALPFLLPALTLPASIIALPILLMGALITKYFYDRHGMNWEAALAGFLTLAATAAMIALPFLLPALIPAASVIPAIYSIMLAFLVALAPKLTWDLSGQNWKKTFPVLMVSVLVLIAIASFLVPALAPIMMGVGAAIAKSFGISGTLSALAGIGVLAVGIEVIAAGGLAIAVKKGEKSPPVVLGNTTGKVVEQLGASPLPSSSAKDLINLVADLKEQPPEKIYQVLTAEYNKNKNLNVKQFKCRLSEYFTSLPDKGFKFTEKAVKAGINKNQNNSEAYFYRASGVDFETNILRAYLKATGVVEALQKCSPSLDEKTSLSEQLFQGVSSQDKKLIDQIFDLLADEAVEKSNKDLENMRKDVFIERGPLFLINSIIQNEYAVTADQVKKIALFPSEPFKKYLSEKFDAASIRKTAAPGAEEEKISEVLSAGP